MNPDDIRALFRKSLRSSDIESTPVGRYAADVLRLAKDVTEADFGVRAEVAPRQFGIVFSAGGKEVVRVNVSNNYPDRYSVYGEYHDKTDVTATELVSVVAECLASSDIVTMSTMRPLPQSSAPSPPPEHDPKVLRAALNRAHEEIRSLRKMFETTDTDSDYGAGAKEAYDRIAAALVIVE